MTQRNTRQQKFIKAKLEGKSNARERFRLQDAENFGALEHLGKKVMVKGVVVRSFPTNVPYVNYIEEIRPDCQ